MNTELIYNTVWNQALVILKTKGWEKCIQEIPNLCYNLVPASEINTIKYVPDLVIGTLLQKFGKLDDALDIFEKVKKTNNPFVRYEAQVKLAKVFSQKGNFSLAFKELKSITENPKQFGKSLYDISQSVFWRLGFLSYFENKADQSLKWYTIHQERIGNTHSSQIANNYIFSNINQLLSGNYDIFKIHDLNLIGFENYLNDGLSVEGVKFVSIAKSIIVPMMLEGLILFKLQQKYNALTQFLLCRKLLSYENLNMNSEGIAEAMICLNNMEYGNLALKIITFSPMNVSIYTSFIKREFREQVVNLAVNEANERFKEFLKFNIYGNLFVTEKSFPDVKIGGQKESVFFIWDGSISKGLELRKYLSESLKVDIYSIDDASFSGLTAFEKINKISAKVKYAVVHHTRNTGYYVGILRAKLGRHRIVELTNPNDKYIEKIGVSSIVLPKGKISTVFTKVRERLTK